MEKTLLIGTGPMAVAYAHVLKALDQPFTVIGRGSKSAVEFEKKINVKPLIGGLSVFLENNNIPAGTKAIIATNTDVLMPVLKLLIHAGISNVLIEKPAAISIDELLGNKDLLEPFAEDIFVAYNRRFYASVIEAKQLIEEDGGLQNVHFEFTEWAHKIEPLSKAPGIKENWFFANSTHVIDLAFFLAGQPDRWHAYSKKGTLQWHEMTNFTGAGVTDKGILFSYLSNWESAGRWSVELLTAKRRIYLKPLEELSIQNKDSITLIAHNIDDKLDKEFKPGLFKQTKAFITQNNTGHLINLKQHINNSKFVYSKILNNGF